MQMANAYRLRDRYLIHPSKRTSAGGWLAQPDFVCLPLHASPEVLGKAVLHSLAQSVGVLPHPTVWAGLSKPRLAAAGVRSEKAFMRGTALVDISLETEMALRPTENGGTTGDQRGFTALLDKRIALPARSSPLDIGRALLLAFDACTSAI